MPKTRNYLCQWCSKGSGRHQIHWENGQHVYRRCLDGDSTTWLPMRWDGDVEPGGYVCAVDDCGLPVESEPCGKHGGAA